MHRTLGIDSSLSGTGLCGVDDLSSDDRPTILETISHPKGVVGMDRLQRIIARIEEAIDIFRPDLIVMEEYALNVRRGPGGQGGGGTNNLTRLAELGGTIKLACHKRGYAMGYGTGRNELEKERSWDATKSADKLFVVQSRMSMCKFVMGQGDIKKDGNLPGYLLAAKKATGYQFADDNQADAFMHQRMAGLMVSVVRGVTKIGDLNAHQQLALIGKNRPKGVSEMKALRLPDEEKTKLIRL